MPRRKRARTPDDISDSILYVDRAALGIAKRCAQFRSFDSPNRPDNPYGRAYKALWRTYMDLLNTSRDLQLARNIAEAREKVFGQS